MNNWGHLLLGIFFLTYALITFYVHATMPHLYSNLIHMKEKYGETWGACIHLILFSIVPFIAGLYFIVFVFWLRPYF